MSHKKPIEESPLQAYTSALIFSPSRSLIRGLFEHEEPKWITIQPPMREKWSACLQTLEGHSKWVGSVAFSHNSTRLASASGDGTVKICLRTPAAARACRRRHRQDLGRRQRHVPADARGPQRFGQIGRLLARLDPARIGVRRWHRQDLGHRQRRVPADARGPQQVGQLGRLLVRLDPARIGVRRWHRQDLGRRQRRVPADARYGQSALQCIIR